MYASMNSAITHYPYPNFMKQRPLKTYTSKKPLGLIYRSTKSMCDRALSNIHCIYDSRLYVEDMYKYIIEARKTKAKYDHSLRILLGRYSVETEVEFVSGHIIHWPKYLNEQYRPVFIEQIKNAYICFREYWKQAFHSQLSSTTNNNNKRNTEIEAKAAAWYYVTYHPSEYKNDVIYNKTLQRYMSFPWVVEEYIIYIAHKNDAREHLPKYMQPISPEKIENYAKLHSGLETKIVFAESDEDDEEEEEEEEEEFDDSNIGSSGNTDEKTSSNDGNSNNHQLTNTYGLDLSRQPQQTEPRSNEEGNEISVLGVKFATLLDI